MADNALSVQVNTHLLLLPMYVTQWMLACSTLFFQLVQALVEISTSLCTERRQ